MSGFVGAAHEFFDPDYAREWANRFAPTLPRVAPFDLILAQISGTATSHGHVVELGSGPGYMARHILKREDRVTCEGVDFSEAIFGGAREIVGQYY